MFLERKARPSDSKKLTIKFINPIAAIPKIPQNSNPGEISNPTPNSPKARLPLAKVICRISKFKPKNAPIIAVEPINTPNQKLEATPGHFSSNQFAKRLVFSLPNDNFNTGCSEMRY